MSHQGWIGVDLDGTMAFYDGWKGHTHIGEPIAPMVRRVQLWLTMGRDVRLFTARACLPEAELDEFIDAWNVWAEKHIGQRLVVTSTKDFQMSELWDDRAVQVIPNTGIPLELS